LPAGKCTSHPFFVQSPKLHRLSIRSPAIFVVQPFLKQSPKLQLTSARSPPGKRVVQPFLKQSPNEQSVPALPALLDALHPFLEQSLNRQSARTSPSQPFFKQSSKRQRPAMGVASKYAGTRSASCEVRLDSMDAGGLALLPELPFDTPSASLRSTRGTLTMADAGIGAIGADLVILRVGSVRATSGPAAAQAERTMDATSRTGRCVTSE